MTVTKRFKINYLYVLFFIALLFFAFSANSDNIMHEINNDRCFYKDTLDKAASLIIKNQGIYDSILLFCIPRTKEESKLYFGLDYNKDKKHNLVYRELKNLWVVRCTEKNPYFIVRYFEFSNFVDGYFAEDYFININKIYKSLGDDMCIYLKQCSQDKIKKLLIHLNGNNMCTSHCHN